MDDFNSDNEVIERSVRIIFFVTISALFYLEENPRTTSFFSRSSVVFVFFLSQLLFASVRKKEACTAVPLYDLLREASQLFQKF